jgi:hypothetical protein
VSPAEKRRAGLNVLRNAITNPLQARSAVLSQLRDAGTDRPSLRRSVKRYIKPATTPPCSKKRRFSDDDDEDTKHGNTEIDDLVLTCIKEQGLVEGDEPILNPCSDCAIPESFATMLFPINTIGDGTCLIHSFLLALSPRYRRLQDHTNERGKIGGKIREFIYDQNEGAKPFERKQGTNISDDAFPFFAKFFRVNLLLLVALKPPDQQDDFYFQSFTYYPGLSYILLHLRMGENPHFSYMMFRDNFLMPHSLMPHFEEIATTSGIRVMESNPDDPNYSPN